MMTLRELANASSANSLVGDPSTVIQNIVYDSRLVEPGSLFVALRGGYFDGHDFLDTARKQGAVAVMAERPYGALPSIVYEDTRKALPRVAAAFFGYPSRRLGVIGITGTDGKTTTSYLVDSVLTQSGAKTGLVGTVSVKIGDEIVEHETRQTTPESLDIQRRLAQMRDADVQWAILESTSHGLAAHRLDDVAFDIAAVTNVTHEHLEYHKSIEAYWRAKAVLFERVAAAGGWAVINLDDRGARYMREFATGARLLTYSRASESADFFAELVECDASGTTAHVRGPHGSVGFRLPYLGDFNVDNALCAMGVGHAAGLDTGTIVRGLEQAPPVPGRLVSVDEGQPFSVVVDYAHTPESLDKILTLLRRLNGSGHVICVSGSAGERDVAKRPMQGAVSVRLADFSVFTTEDPRFEDAMAIIDDIAAGASAVGAVESVDFARIVDRREAIGEALRRAKPGDVVLLAGKGHERSIIWGLEKQPWDEAEVTRETLRALGFESNAQRAH
jgi:UDP-N-acetylmuramoyl-L-alanyl-D-glutamate--2,6-diaminopimelate ligase